MGTIERLLGAPRRRRRRRRRPICCARTSRATWAGSSIATARSTRASGATTTSSRRWWRASAPTSSTTSIRRASAAGSPSATGDRRLGVPRAEVEDRRQAAAAAGRTVGARARHRPAADRRVHPLRAPGRLPQDHALDPERSRRRAPSLSAGRLPLRSIASRTTASAASDLVAETWELTLSPPRHDRGSRRDRWPDRQSRGR